MTEAWLIEKILETREDAKEYLSVFKEVTGGYGTDIHPKSWKPLSVRHPEVFAKANLASEMLGLNYWQMPYEEAKIRFCGLSHARWLKKRTEKGLQ